MSHQTVLITGAFGQVGSRCAEILLRRGHTVVATDLKTPATEAVAARLAGAGHPGVFVTVYADLLDPEAVADLFAEHEPSAIVHLAAIFSPSSYRNPKLARRVNVGGTATLVEAAATLPAPPIVLLASSASVYGSRNPYRHPELITPQTPVNPIDQYGEDKVLAEKVITDSGLPYAMLRLAGIISPDGAANMNSDYLVLMRATPGDNRLHTVDARDVGLAFANGVERATAIAGKVLLIGGDETHRHTHRDVEDDMMAAMGLGRLGPTASLPGDPDDERGWSFTGWYDTTESQALLDFQEHPWPETVAWVAGAQSRVLRTVLGLAGPLIRPAMRLALAAQRRHEGRGRYADPWTFIAGKYGPEALAGAADEQP
ncbi:NAD(P)-dependent oxidoreductase [Mycobacterium sp. CVI_P3]|uniref:NAD(P)-dependent oxidoreductase n=1 Tax=Mycobacterium pinniadriaticum TaxID=2994102 RepID=A0ABT3SEP1_9MYCO|nr:NAD(P)-dependent oxidoreductase [Mycobacterium pinniadriaticum]MCX2931624.1 NAD(P)-dependent oxidoreductase [Mycobacterium pinniadriaticum]MCX2937984.1 NAD(P)-dependent oxidoreductase [Mycobacterium pinniadriaticum]